MHLFYTPEMTDAEIYPMGAEESRHAVGVLRLREGARVQLTDGRGLWCEAELMAGATAKQTVVRILSRRADYGRRPYRLHVAIAPTKNIDRYEWFLEKATEIGIDRITPILCEHSERKVLRRDRGERIIMSAVKQSLKAYVPKLDELISLKEFIATASAEAGYYRGRFVAHCDEATLLEDRVSLFSEFSSEFSTAVEGLNKGVEHSPEYCVLIGPEGDFSPTEIMAARELGFIPVTLGESRLRTETAGVMAAAMAQIALFTD